MTTHAAKMTTQELNEALHAHFIRPDDQISQTGAGAVYLNEVTAPGSNRRADAVHIGLWASRSAGRIDVCELKTSKADFRRELDNPEKAEAWWPYCNAFWIVAPSTDIVPPEDLPDGWGLMVPGARGRRFRTVVQPKEREVSLSVSLLITLLKCTETVRVNSLRQQESKLRNEFWEREKNIKAARQGLSSGDKARLDLLDELEGALGVELGRHHWRGEITPQTAADGLREFMQDKAAAVRVREDAERAAQRMEQLALEIREQANALRKTANLT